MITSALAQQGVQFGYRAWSKAASMLNSSYLLLVLPCCAFIASGQPRIDSLNFLLVNTRNDSLSAVLQKRLGYEYYLKGLHEKSIVHYNKALDYYELQNDASNQATVLAAIAETYRNEHVPGLAIDYFLRSARMFDQHGRTAEVSRIYNSMTDLFLRQGDLGSALVYMNKSRKILELSPDKEALAQLYNNEGRVYNDYKKYDTAIYYYDQAAMLFGSLDLRHDQGRALHNKANSLRERGDLNDALTLCRKVLEMKEINENIKSKVFSLLLMSNIYADMKNSDQAIKFALEGLQLSERYGFKDRQRVALLYLSDAYELVPDYKLALHYHKKYADLMDIVYDSSKYIQVARMKTVYETEKQEQTIEIQKANLEANNAVIELAKTKANFLFIAVIFVFILGLVLFVGYLNKTKRNRMLVAQKNEIERQNSEREVLLKEIHHRVKNNLQVISSLLSMQSRTMKESEAKAAVREGQSRIKSMSLIHQKLYGENNLSKINMREYIEELSDFLFKSYKPGNDIHKLIEAEELLLDVDIAMPLGLIVNELISNALKYAFDPKMEGMVKVSLLKVDSSLVLNISDSGKGLPQNFSSSQSMGMNLVNILVTQLDGTMHISQGEGTSFVIKFKDKRAA